MGCVIGDPEIAKNSERLGGEGLVEFDYADVGERDLAMVQGEVLVITAAILVIGFAVDVAHRLIDPRLGGRE